MGHLVILRLLHLSLYRFVLFYLDLDNATQEIDNINEKSENQLSKREQHLARAPFVPFDTDLRYWEESKIERVVSYKTDSLHRFWKTNEHQEEFVPEQVEASMRERCMCFDTEFVPVTRKNVVHHCQVTRDVNEWIGRNVPSMERLWNGM